jgi:serine/threonine protein kinase
LASICRRWEDDELEEDGLIARGAEDTEIWRVHPRPRSGHGHAAGDRTVYPKTMVLKLMPICSLNIYRCCNEAKALHTLQHPHVLKLYGFVRTNKFVGLVLEEARCDLYETYNKNDKFTPLPLERVKKYLRQTIAAIAHCHAHHVLCADNKAENLLVSWDDNIKLADFGGAIWTKVQHKRPELICTFCCTCPEIAHAMLSKQTLPNTAFTTQSDMWSIGVLMFEMLCGHVPFWQRLRKDHSASRKQLKLTMRKIEKDRALIKSWPSVFNSPQVAPAKAIIQQLLQVEPEKRTTAAELLENPWFYDAPERKA